MHSKIGKSVIIAETAFNHEGDKDYLLKLIEEVSLTGVTHIKFQVLLDFDEFVSTSSDNYELTKNWCFNKEEWEEIFSHSESRGLRLFLMPLDTKAVDFCQRPTVDFVEIHSVSFNDESLKGKVRENLSDKKLVFGIGGRVLEEILSLKESFEDDKLLLMHGFQAFPTILEDVRLARLAFLRLIFPDSYLGYADHSSPDVADSVYSSIYAYHLGARFFEKHVTLSSGRTDAQSGLLPSQLASFVKEIRRFESAIGLTKEASFELGEAELVYRNRQKQVVANERIKCGQVIRESDLALKMHTQKGFFTIIDDVVGKVAAIDYNIGDVIVGGGG